MLDDISLSSSEQNLETWDVKVKNNSDSHVLATFQQAARLQELFKMLKGQRLSLIFTEIDRFFLEEALGMLCKNAYEELDRRKAIKEIHEAERLRNLEAKESSSKK